MKTIILLIVFLLNLCLHKFTFINLLTFAANSITLMVEWMFTLDAIAVAAEDFWQRFAGKKVFAFHAAMGAGKTTFIHALCDVLKVNSHVSSPTFSIINEYSSAAGIVYHIDLYRLQGGEEAIRTGVEDSLYSENICLVEWPERAPAIFPADTVHVWMEAIDSQTRRMQVHDK
jgi:tRNA threonylcarbamoyladenosine biosynthesis protein TsaE